MKKILIIMVLNISFLLPAQTLQECCVGPGINGNGEEMITWGDFECLPTMANEATFEAGCGDNNITIDPGFNILNGPCVGDNNFAVINPQVTTNCYRSESNFDQDLVDPNGNIIGPGNRSLFVNGGSAYEIFCFDLATELCKNYCFSAYVLTDCCGDDTITGNADGNPSAVGFSADGIILNEPVPVAQNTGWKGYASTFFGTGEAVTLCVIDAEPNGFGNDWVLDNISTYPINSLLEIDPIEHQEICAVTENIPIGLTSCTANAGPYTITISNDNPNVITTNSPITVPAISDFPADLVITGNASGDAGMANLTVNIVDNNGCTAEEIAFSIDYLGRPPEIICPPQMSIQCIDDTLTSFLNVTQFLDQGGSINFGCGEVEFKCISQTIE